MKQTRRGIVRDRKIKAKYRPRKRFKKGLGNKGDWSKKKYKGMSKKKGSIVEDVVEDIFK